jgi:hypothetical protein
VIPNVVRSSIPIASRVDEITPKPVVHDWCEAARSLVRQALNNNTTGPAVRSKWRLMSIKRQTIYCFGCRKQELLSDMIRIVLYTFEPVLAQGFVSLLNGNSEFCLVGVSSSPDNLAITLTT